MKDRRMIPGHSETLLRENDFIVYRTDTRGRITCGRHIYIELSGYSEEELLGSQHNIIRHPDVLRGVIKPLRGMLVTGKEVFAYVKNPAQDGSLHWVFANVTPSINRQRKVDGCFSVRRQSSRSAVDTAGGLYAQIFAMPLRLLVNVLNQQGTNYA